MKKMGSLIALLLITVLGQVTATAQGGAALASGDRNFMTNAAMTDMFEIQSSRLALDKAASAAVKTFAQRMIDDHTRTSDQLKQIAANKNVTLPTALDSKHQAQLAKLSAASGAEFDRMYMAAQHAGHQKAVAMFEKEARSGRDADVKSFAQATLPALQEHLTMAREEHKGHGGMNH